MTTGTLWLVPTPIGNLGDFTSRAVDVLSHVSLLCCEDTRRTGRLLQLSGITAPRLAVCNEHTEHDLVERVVTALQYGNDVAVVSDAGTPGISDPGERLVAAAVAAGLTVTALPGACAAVTALTASGLPTGRWVMEGFLPRSGQSRNERLTEIATERRTTVLYEAPHRIRRTLDDLSAACGSTRRVTVARELTKIHEEYVHGTLGTIDIGEPRGEYVIIVDGFTPDTTPPDTETIRSALDDVLAEGVSRRDAASIVAERLGVPRRLAYDLAIGARITPQPNE
jgi:16S rRNA (cytidine1402-2'-O)-methyltransferase